MNKSLKTILIILSCLVVIFVIITLLVSPIAKSYINNHGEDLIGRKMNIDKLKVNIYSGSVKICDLKVYEDDKSTEFLSFDTLDVSVKLRKLLAKEVYVRHLTLANLDVNVIQNGDKFNFSSIIDHFASDDTEEDDTSTSTWKLGFYNIRLAHWKVYYADRKQGSEWNLKDLNIEIPGVYFSGDQATDAGLNLTLADGGELNTQVKYTMETNDFDITLGLKNIALSNIKAYLTDVMNVGELKGNLSADMRAVGNLSKLLDMDISGTASLDGTNITDKGNNTIASCQLIMLKINKISINENFYDIACVEIDNLKSRFDLYKSTNNFSQFFDVKSSTPAPQEQTSSPDTTTESSKPMQLRIGQFNLHNTQLTFADHTLPDPFSFDITNINASATNLSLSGDNNLKLTAALPHGGNAVIDWKGSLDDIKRAQNLRLNIKNIQLQDLSPYCVAYLGQPLTDGTFSFTSLNTINHSELKGDNHIDIYKPQVGKRRKDVDSTLHIPLKAALYVLKDKDDKVQLDVPISGNIDNPEFSYMKLVWKTLRNLLVKVATSPARGIANALGISNNNLEFLPFEATQTDFTSEQYYVMEQLAQVTNVDSNIVILMEQQIAASENDTCLLHAEERNLAIKRHFANLGVPERQIRISTSTTRSKKTGYALSSELLIEE